MPKGAVPGCPWQAPYLQAAGAKRQTAGVAVTSWKTMRFDVEMDQNLLEVS